MWGYVNVSGVEFFTELGRPLPPCCPIKKLPNGFCPHKTRGEPVRKMPLGIYFYEENSYNFPRNVEVEGSTLLYTGSTLLSLIKPLLKQTNYIPLVILNFRLDGKQDSFLERLYNMVMTEGRPVVLMGDDYIPLPKYVKRVRKKG